MRLFDRSASTLAAGPTLLLPADPGPALFDAARQYDPGVRYSTLLRRLIFSNGVLLLGPVKVTPGMSDGRSSLYSWWKSRSREVSHASGN